MRIAVIGSLSTNRMLSSAHVKYKQGRLVCRPCVSYSMHLMVLDDDDGCLWGVINRALRITRHAAVTTTPPCAGGARR
jgi:hypothetical protein